MGEIRQVYITEAVYDSFNGLPTINGRYRCDDAPEGFYRAGFFTLYLDKTPRGAFPSRLDEAIAVMTAAGCRMDTSGKAPMPVLPCAALPNAVEGTFAYNKAGKRCVYINAPRESKPVTAKAPPSQLELSELFGRDPKALPLPPTADKGDDDIPF